MPAFIASRLRILLEHIPFIIHGNCTASNYPLKAIIALTPFGSQEADVISIAT